VIKEDEIGETRMEEKRNVYRIFVGKPTGKILQIVG
jgi:hypothetical protein